MTPEDIVAATGMTPTNVWQMMHRMAAGRRGGEGRPGEISPCSRRVLTPCQDGQEVRKPRKRPKVRMTASQEPDILTNLTGTQNREGRPT